MPFEPLEEKRMYRRAESLCDAVWELVAAWDRFPKQTVGEQLARAADSVGANIAEAGGRFHPGDVTKFLYYARGSLRETKFWLRRSLSRGLLDGDRFREWDAELEQLSREIHEAIRFQRTRKTAH